MPQTAPPTALPAEAAAEDTRADARTDAPPLGREGHGGVVARSASRPPPARTPGATLHAGASPASPSPRQPRGADARPSPYHVRMRRAPPPRRGCVSVPRTPGCGAAAQSARRCDAPSGRGPPGTAGGSGAPTPSRSHVGVAPRGRCGAACAARTLRAQLWAPPLPGFLPVSTKENKDGFLLNTEPK